MKSLFNFQCLLKCIFQEDGTINKEGYQDDIAAAFYFEETFAPEVQQLSFPYIQACFPLAGTLTSTKFGVFQLMTLIRMILQILFDNFAR